MPRVIVVETIGRNLIEGMSLELTNGQIAELDKQAPRRLRGKWYRRGDPAAVRAARKKFAAEEQEAEAAARAKRDEARRKAEAEQAAAQIEANREAIARLEAENAELEKKAGAK